jgi:hypothetical protein
MPYLDPDKPPRTGPRGVNYFQDDSRCVDGLIRRDGPDGKPLAYDDLWGVKKGFCLTPSDMFLQKIGVQESSVPAPNLAR